MSEKFAQQYSECCSAVLDELSAAGIEDKDITIVFALGSHGGHTEERMRYMVGDAVYETAKALEIPQDSVWTILSASEKKFARIRGLI